MAALFVSVSASQNILNGWSLGIATSEIHAAIFAAGSLAGAICQPVSWYAAWLGFSRKQTGRAIIAAVLGLTCLAYATLSSLAFVSTARTDGIAGREKSADLYQLSSDRAAAALAELKTINNTPRGNARTEARKAERRSQLDLLIADAEKALRGDSAPGPIDPAASSLASYASALGWRLSEAQISPWLTAAIVLFFEIGAGLSLIVVSLVAGAAQVKLAPKPEVDSDAQPDGASDTEPEPNPPGRPRGRPRSATPESVIARIRSNGGAVSGNLNAIGRVIGLPAKTTTHRVLRELQATGHVNVQTTADGISVRLLAS
ncbi:hypothetical protein [Hyphomicrobium sp. MC1]|uniref:hypothetical protein n=1 Tax=Hyphomicrobium sp. (strain MC1) TaxID=717785 RepID=UPI0002FACE24|nr:hypothetical protein [Hyphomicrobium sp. MC1]